MKRVLAVFLVMGLVLSAFSYMTTVNATETKVSVEKDYDAMTLEELMNLDDSLTWVFAGDSITHNSKFTSGLSGYGEWFERYLNTNEARKEDDVIISAWGGADIQDFVLEEETVGNNGIYEDPGMGVEGFITKYNPDVIFVKIGMNNRGNSMTSNAFKMHYRQMLDAVYSICETEYHKRPKVILLSTTPLTTEELEFTYGTLDRRNDTEEIAEEYGLLFCDLRTAFFEEKEVLGSAYLNTLYDSATGETVHPNAAGQYFMFKTLCKTLEVYDETLPIFQIEYEDINQPSLYTDKTANINYDVKADDMPARTVGWEDTLAENNVWMVAGAEQMSGYDVCYPNRSLFRLIDNGIRYGGKHRDIRMVDAATPGYNTKTLYAEYDSIIGENGHQVFLLLPEISQIYKNDYQHSEEEVASYKTTVTQLLQKEKALGNACVLWTPLASADETINGYVSEYADAIREIAREDTSILFFDANKFMNENLKNNESLTRNWFANDAYITPLCAVDVAHSFLQMLDENVSTSIGASETLDHNLRYGSDKRLARGIVIRDCMSPDSVTVDGKKVTIDLTTIQETYKLTSVSFAVLPTVGAGDNHKGIYEIEKVTVSDNKYTFKAPCTNPIIAIYGQGEVQNYRFQDITVEVTVNKLPFHAVIIAGGILTVAIVGTVVGICIHRKKKTPFTA